MALDFKDFAFLEFEDHEVEIMKLVMHLNNHLDIPVSLLHQQSLDSTRMTDQGFIG
jgi:hypothetical protein